jgi:hypothetical protein
LRAVCEPVLFEFIAAEVSVLSMLASVTKAWRRTNDNALIDPKQLCYFETRGGMNDSSFLIAREFVNAGCHFHIYMHPLAKPPMDSDWFTFLYGDYLALGAIISKCAPMGRSSRECRLVWFRFVHEQTVAGLGKRRKRN